MQTEARAVVVARALVEDDVEVRREPMHSIQVHVGEPVTFRFAYHVTERSPLRDAWRMQLQTRHRRGDRVAANGHADQAAGPTVVWHSLEATYRFRKPGAVVVAFVAEALMEQVPHAEPASPFLCRHGVQGSIAVMVLP